LQFKVYLRGRDSNLIGLDKGILTNIFCLFQGRNYRYINNKVLLHPSWIRIYDYALHYIW